MRKRYSVTLFQAKKEMTHKFCTSVESKGDYRAVLIFLMSENNIS